VNTRSPETFDIECSQISCSSGHPDSGMAVADATVSISVNPCPTRLLRCLTLSVAGGTFLGTLTGQCDFGMVVVGAAANVQDTQ